MAWVILCWLPLALQSRYRSSQNGPAISALLRWKMITFLETSIQDQWQKLTQSYTLRKRLTFNLRKIRGKKNLFDLTTLPNLRCPHVAAPLFSSPLPFPRIFIFVYFYPRMRTFRAKSRSLGRTCLWDVQSGEVGLELWVRFWLPPSKWIASRQIRWFG